MLIFWIKEAFRSVSRAKSSFILSLISTTISVMLIITSLVAIQLSASFESMLKEKISLDLFLKDNVDKSAREKIEKEISSKEFVSSAVFISKEQAADNFVKETGEDFRNILDYNPLPASFTITLKDEFVTREKLREIVAVLSKIEGADEVVYQQDFIHSIVTFIDNLKTYIFIITIVLFLISVYIIYSTVKLILNSRKEELETMKLVGAKLSSIKMPVIINGVLIGVIAGLISLLFFYFGLNQIESFSGIDTSLLIRNPINILTVLLIGPVSGFLVSVVSLSGINLKI